MIGPVFQILKQQSPTQRLERRYGQGYSFLFWATITHKNTRICPFNQMIFNNCEAFALNQRAYRLTEDFKQGNGDIILTTGIVGNIDEHLGLEAERCVEGEDGQDLLDVHHAM